MRFLSSAAGGARAGRTPGGAGEPAHPTQGAAGPRTDRSAPDHLADAHDAHQQPHPQPRHQGQPGGEARRREGCGRAGWRGRRGSGEGREREAPGRATQVRQQRR